MIFPSSKGLQNYFPISNGTLTLADKITTLKIIGRGNYGILKNVLVCPDIPLPIISVPKLSETGLVTVFLYEKAYILAKLTTEFNYDIIATATRKHDGLYHIDNLERFNKISQFYPVIQHKINTITTISSSHSGLNPLEWLHVRLAHANERLLKHIVKNNIVSGIGVSWDEIKHLKLKMCDACMRGKMKSFPIPASITNKVYKVFEYVSVDIVYFNSPSIKNFLYSALYVDKATTKVFQYPMKLKSELLETLKSLIREYGKGQNPKSIELRILQSDWSTEITNKEFTDYLKENNIKFQSSAPSKHAQNLVERYVYTMKDGVRTVMLYNKAPFCYWNYALDYFIETFNNLPRMGNLKSRNEEFYGIKPDISIAVPFYASGYYNVTKKERELLKTNKVENFDEKGKACKFLGYANKFVKDDKSEAVIYLKDSYICLVGSNSIIVRHDCYFRHYTDSVASLLNEEVMDREVDTILPTPEPNYDELLGPSRLENLPTQDEEQLLILKPLNNTPDVKESNTSQNESQSNDEKNNEKNDEKVLDSESTTEAKLTKRAKLFQDKKLQVPVRKSTRISQLFNNKYTKFRLENHKKNKHLNNLITKQLPVRNPKPVPKTLLDALNGPDKVQWLEAWKSEIKRITERKTWIPVFDENNNQKAIKSKLCFRIVVKPDGSLKYKVRLVACGYSQIYGRDYLETFSPTAKYKSFCIIMHIAAVYGWYIKGLDVENAFIESELDKEIYMYLPSDVYCNKLFGKIKVKLLKSLYGLKQAGELWYKLLISKFIKFGFKEIAHDVCVFIKRDEETGIVIILIIYVDDIIVTGNDELTIDTFIDTLADEFTKLHELGEIKRYIGIDIERDEINHRIKLTQQPYTKAVIDSSEFYINQESSKLIPMPSSIDYTNIKTSDENNLESDLQERSGKWRFLADRTRPDILTAASLIGSGSRNPSDILKKGEKHLTEYMQATQNLGLELGGDDKNINLFGYSDASYLPHGDSRSQLAYCFFLNLNSGTVCARTLKSTSVSHSSTEAEVKALDEAIRQSVWLRGFLLEIGFPQNSPTLIYVDNQSAIILAEQYRLGNNTSHMVMRLNYIHQEILNGNVTVKFIDTENQVADILTKLLPIKPFSKLRDILLKGHNNVFPTPIIKESKETKNNKVTFFEKIRRQSVKNKKIKYA
jgi:transposase InsO family protein